MNKAWSVFRAEMRESFLMAMSALAAHKLRSALTLLGVLVGVFSIIVVMTAMRVLQNNIEKELSELGSHTFQVRKWPAIYFGGPEGFEKFWRRKNITLAQGRQVQERATLARNVGLEEVFWNGVASSRYEQTPPTVRMFGVTPGNFPARNWTVAEGRPLIEADVEGVHDVCVLGAGLAKTLFPFGSAIGDRIKLNGINYSVAGVLEPLGAALGGEQDNFVVIPITTGLNRYGRAWRSLSILVQARDAASYEDTVQETEYPYPICHGGGGALRSGRSGRRGAGHHRRQCGRLLFESPARLSGGLGGARFVDLLGSRRGIRDLPGLESREF